MYEVYEENIVNEEKGAYLSYGIKCNADGRYISDITCDKLKLKKFVNLLNKEVLEPIHLDDVIEDNLNDLI